MGLRFFYESRVGKVALEFVEKQQNRKRSLNDVSVFDAPKWAFAVVLVTKMI